MRCDGAGPDSASSQPVMARASSLWTAISQHVTAGHSAPASAMMIAPAASPTRWPRAWWLPRVRADQEVYQGLSDASGASGRHREWMRSTASTTTPTRQMSAGAGKGST